MLRTFYMCFLNKNDVGFKLIQIRKKRTTFNGMTHTLDIPWDKQQSVNRVANYKNKTIKKTEF